MQKLKPFCYKSETIIPKHIFLTLIFVFYFKLQNVKKNASIACEILERQYLPQMRSKKYIENKTHTLPSSEILDLFRMWHWQDIG